MHNNGIPSLGHSMSSIVSVVETEIDTEIENKYKMLEVIERAKRKHPKSSP